MKNFETKNKFYDNFEYFYLKFKKSSTSDVYLDY